MNQSTPLAKWDAKQIPSLQGKEAIVTGANSGIGYVTSLELARKGAHVVLACRNDVRGKAAQEKIQNALKNVDGAGKVKFMKLDVGDLNSVNTFAEVYRKTHNRLDLLINNAGIFAVPYTRTVDGLESQMATNHLGHFALTAKLFDLLSKSDSARIVNVSSLSHRRVSSFTGEDLVTPESKYVAMNVYAETKLVNILFTAELTRRLENNGIKNVIAVVAHPGITESNIMSAPSENGPWYSRWMWSIVRKLPLYQTSAMGALPMLYAATAPQVGSGKYYGPNGWNALWGYPQVEDPQPLAKSVTAAQNVWEQSERLTRTSFPINK